MYVCIEKHQKIWENDIQSSNIIRMCTVHMYRERESYEWRTERSSCLTSFRGSRTGLALERECIENKCQWLPDVLKNKTYSNYTLYHPYTDPELNHEHLRFQCFNWKQSSKKARMLVNKLQLCRYNYCLGLGMLRINHLDYYRFIMQVTISHQYVSPYHHCSH